MTLLTMAVFSALVLLPLRAEDPVPIAQSAEYTLLAWRAPALQAQALMKQARFAEAVESAKRALDVAKTFGPSDSRLASTYYLLGTIYRTWGRCAEARTNYLRAITIWRREAHPNTHYVVYSITNFLSTLCECDDFKGAEKAFHVYQSDLQRYASNPREEASLLSVRAALARGRKDYAQAETLFRQAIELMQKVPETSPVEVAGEQSNLAVVVGKQGRNEEALAESMRAIAILGETAPKHPSLIAALNNAACILSDLGRPDDSERMFQRALAAATDLYGEDNHVTAGIMLNYADVLRRNKQSPEADALQKRGSAAFHRALIHDTGTIDLEELRR